MIAGQLALLTAAVFTGAALYVSVVEQPARLGLNDRCLLLEWKPAYKRGTVMQAPLAVIGFVLGLAAWWQTGHIGWIIGALLMIANWPVTLFRHHADEYQAHDDRALGSWPREPRDDREMGLSSRHANGARTCRVAQLPLGFSLLSPAPRTAKRPSRNPRSAPCAPPPA